LGTLRLGRQNLGTSTLLLGRLLRSFTSLTAAALGSFTANMMEKVGGNVKGLRPFQDGNGSDVLEDSLIGGFAVLVFPGRPVGLLALLRRGRRELPGRGGTVRAGVLSASTRLVLRAAVLGTV